MKTYEVEMAVGYDYGGWEMETTEVVVHDDTLVFDSPDFREYLEEAASEEIEESLGYNKDVSFMHLMYYNLKGNENA